MKKVCVIGLGYIGLPTAILLAKSGFDVVGFDIDEEKVKKINNFDPVIHEPEILDQLFIALKSGNFRASNNIELADYFIVGVPTPITEDKKADLTYVWQAADSLVQVLSKGNTIILESTVPVGTTNKLAKYLEEKTYLKAGKDFFVAFCPERVLPGKIFQELVNNNRIIGGINRESALRANNLYSSFVNSNVELTDSSTAEMVKLVENSSRDVQVAFAHQVASMAYAQDLNPYEVIELANKHPRVKILTPRCGVGGHCIAVDPWFLVESFPEQSILLKVAREVNDNKPYEVLNFINNTIDEFNSKYNKKCNVLVLGVTYKPDVDDLRESPALLIAKELSKKENINLKVVEPYINPNLLNKIFDDKVASLQDGLQYSDLIICLVAHKQFIELNYKLFDKKLVLDFTGMKRKKNMHYITNMNQISKNQPEEDHV